MLVEGAGRPMPRYFFHISMGSAYVHDYEGVELATEAAARQRAIQDILAVWGASVIRRQDPAACAVLVTDGTKELFRVPFVEAPGVLPGT